MSKRCVHCNEAWEFEDYVCPVCDRCAVEQDSDMKPTLEYKTWEVPKGTIKECPDATFTYDVFRISTGKSIWGEDA